MILISILRLTVAQKLRTPKIMSGPTTVDCAQGHCLRSVDQAWFTGCRPVGVSFALPTALPACMDWGQTAQGCMYSWSATRLAGTEHLLPSKGRSSTRR